MMLQVEDDDIRSDLEKIQPVPAIDTRATISPEQVDWVIVKLSKYFLNFKNICTAPLAGGQRELAAPHRVLGHAAGLHQPHRHR